MPPPKHPGAGENECRNLERLSGNMRTAAIRLLFLFGMLCVSPVSAQGPIVTVLISEASGVQDFGSGFVSGANGEVLTCYHVIEGAVKIKVFYKGVPYPARATGISPERDIARLQMTGAPLPTEFLRLSYMPSPDTLSHQMHVFGFAAGLFDQRVPAEATQDRFALSQQMKGVKGETLFQVSDVKILPIVTTLYKGMSGSPLIAADGSVLGLVSGSLSQGGSIAWAISAEYSAALRPVNTLGTGFNWPPLTLMASGWENLRRQSGLGSDLASRIEQVFTAADLAQAQAASICRQVPSVVAGWAQMRSALNDTRFDPYSLSTVGNAPGGADFANRLSGMLDNVNSTAKQVEAAAAGVNAAIDQTTASVNSVIGAVNVFVRGLPQTPANQTLQFSVVNQMANISGQIKRNHDEAASLINRGSLNTPNTVPEFRTWVQGKLDFWDGTQQVYCRIFPDQVRLMRAAGSVYRQLLSADVFGNGQ